MIKLTAILGMMYLGISLLIRSYNAKLSFEDKIRIVRRKYTQKEKILFGIEILIKIAFFACAPFGGTIFVCEYL